MVVFVWFPYMGGKFTFTLWTNWQGWLVFMEDFENGLTQESVPYQSSILAEVFGYFVPTTYFRAWWTALLSSNKDRVQQTLGFNSTALPENDVTSLFHWTIVKLESDLSGIALEDWTYLGLGYCKFF